MRRLPTFLALLGCLLNALAMPYAAAHAAPAPLDAALAADLAIICHGDGSTTTDTANAKERAPPRPTDQSGGCPVCKGVVGFQLAVLVAGEIGLLRPVSTEVEALPSVDDRLSAPTLFAPRSRAPPLFV